ncbi:MAG TPA: PAS domain S-box protein, partial [Terriglobales bacterium]|nr:PAS domain S-box protein [Terriglobales bacterium]
ENIMDKRYARLRTAADLVHRSFAGPIGCVAAVAVLLFSTPLYRDHQLATGLFIGALMARVVPRPALALIWRHHHPEPMQPPMWLIVISACLLSIPAGLFTAFVITQYGFDSWSTLVVFVFAMSCAISGTSAIAPYLKLGLFFEGTLLLPIIAGCLRTGGSRSWIAGISVALFSVYVVIHAARLNNDYRNDLAAECAMKQRAQELEQARTIAEASRQKLVLHRALSPLATIEWDLNFRVVDWNPAAERIFGYTLQEALGREALAFLIASRDRKRVAQIFSDLVSGKDVAPDSGENITKNGRTILCEWYNTSLVDAAGEVIGIASIVQDVTEARQLQQQLAQSQKMEAIGRLAGGVAHDFNNMLMVISSYTELMLGDLTDERARRRGERILDASRRAADLIRQLLAFSRKQLITPRVLNMNAVVKELGKMLPRLIGENIELHLRLAEQVRFCKADPTHIEQLIMNLVVNARDAMPDGGRLVLETADVDLDGAYAADHSPIAPGHYVRLAVKDSGVGMGSDLQAHIFEPFFTTKEVGKGTGLGLSTVYGIVQQTGGHVSVDSAPGFGSTFNIYLPAIEEIEAAGGEKISQEPGSARFGNHSSS